jgi:hypothetical protein
MSGRGLLNVENEPHDIGNVTPHICHSGHRYPVISITDHVRVRGIKRDQCVNM